MSDTMGQDYTDRPDAFEPAHLADEEAKKQLALSDSFANFITALGTSDDKKMGGRYEQTRALRYDHSQLTALYRENWIAGKLVDVVPEDMTRTWRRVTTEKLKPEQINEWEEMEEFYRVRHYFNFAHKMARLYGGSLLVLSVDDGKNPDEPLVIDEIKKGQLKHMKVVDLTRVTPARHIVTNPLDEDYGRPEYYRFHEAGVRIHRSRCIRFEGIELPFMEFRRNHYWHDSVLNRLYDAIRNLDTVTENSASLVYESNVDVVKVAGMMDYLQSPEGTQLLTRRMQMQKLLKAITNQTIVDADDDFHNVTKQFTGLPSLLDRYLVMLTAGSDVPAGRLLGDSASAFNVTGVTSDIKNYYDGIQSKQVLDYNPKLNILDRVLLRNLGWSKGTEIDFVWNSLFQKSPEEEAKAEKARAEVYSLLHNNQVMLPYQIAEELQNNPYFTSITKETVDELKKQDEFNQEIENDTKVVELDQKKNPPETSTGGGAAKPTEEKSKNHTDKAGSDAKDPGKQIRDMKPEKTKENKEKNREARSRGTDQ